LGFIRPNLSLSTFHLNVRNYGEVKKSREASVTEQKSAEGVEFEDLFICSAKCVSFNYKSVKSFEVS
jgi:hypothetical protein